MCMTCCQLIGAYTLQWGLVEGNDDIATVPTDVLESKLLPISNSGMSFDHYVKLL